MAVRLEELGEKDIQNVIMKTDGSISDFGTSAPYNGSQRDGSDLRTNRNDSRVTKNNDPNAPDNDKPGRKASA